MIKLDKRTTKDLFIEMKERLQKYDKRYDFGEGSQLYALFMLYSEMLFQCIRHYNMSPNTHKKTFLDIFNLSPIRAEAAEAQLGFIRADGYDEPITIPKGTEVYANKDKEIGFRTVNDSISMFNCAPAEVHLYCDPGDMQTYIDFYIADFFWIRNNFQMWIFITMEFYKDGAYVNNPRFFCTEKFTWLFISEEIDGEHEYVLSPASTDSEIRIILDNTSNFKEFNGNGKIRIIYNNDIYNPSSSSIILKSMILNIGRHEYSCRNVVINEEILKPQDFYPFGLPFKDYSSFYINCINMMKNPNTVGTIIILCDFHNSMDKATEQCINDNIQVKGINAYPSDISYDYWNGLTFKPLQSAGEPFPTKFKDSRIDVRYVTPKDIAPFTIGNITSYFLRIRSGNCLERYKDPHTVHTPFVRDVHALLESMKTPVSKIFTNYFGEYKELKYATYSPDISGYWLFPYQLGQEELLVGFDSLPPAGEHLCTYVKVKREGLDSGVLKICHLGSNTQLNTADSTDNLRKSGELSFVPLAGAKKETLYGKEAYWFKFGGNKNCDVTNFTIYPYYTKARNINKSEAIYYLADLEDTAVNLPHKQLIKVNVYVFEREEWWEWKEAKPKDIVLKYGSYKVDYEKGIVYFPSPITAYAYEDEAIKISYEACDGVYANLPDDSVNRLDEEIPNIVGVRSIISMAGVDAETHSMRRQRTLNFLHDLNNPIPAAKREGDCIEDPPDLERMEYSSMIRQAMLRIPALCPEWTDHNPQDTGIMLLELCAAYCEMLGYYADNMGDRFLYQYLELLTGDKRGKYESLLSFIIALSDLVHGTSRAVTADDYKTVLKLLKQPELTGIDTDVKGFDVSLKLKKGKDEPLSEEEKNIVRNYLEDYRQLCSVITFI